MTSAAHNALEAAYPTLGGQLPRAHLIDAPTPLTTHARSSGVISIKHDEATSQRYGGSKVRKLEYLLERAQRHGLRRVVTFGTVASHHTIATATFAAALGLRCTCLLYQQAPSAATRQALAHLLSVGAELIAFGGKRQQRLQTLRASLASRDATVIPLGGTSWLGAIGYVNAGLELAAQLAADADAAPRQIYIAAGTMGSAAGLALGLALAGRSDDVQAVQISPPSVANRFVLERVLRKTAIMMRRLDPAIPDTLERKSNIVLRTEQLGGGYAVPTAAARTAVALARDSLGLTLETTYTGKALAALLADKHAGAAPVFWNTYAPAMPLQDAPDWGRLPDDLRRYRDA